MLNIPILGNVIKWCDSHKLYGLIVVLSLLLVAGGTAYALNDFEARLAGIEGDTADSTERILEKIDALQVQSEMQYREIREDIRVLIAK